MPNSNNPMEQEKYQAMTTEELQQLLRDDASNSEGEENLNDLLCVMEVLAQRRKEQAPGRTPEEALEEFQKYYLETEEAFKKEREQTGKRIALWLRRVAAAAAILVLLFTGMVTAKAMGLEPLSILVTWTKETFILRYETQPTVASIPAETLPDPTATYNSLAEALEAYHMDSSIIPTWLPEGYELTDITTYADETWRCITAGYGSSDGDVVVIVQDYTGGTHIEQSGSICETYERSSVTYYFLQNNARNVVTWLVDGYQCTIGGGSLSVEELKQMINSIEKG